MLLYRTHAIPHDTVPVLVGSGNSIVFSVDEGVWAGEDLGVGRAARRAWEAVGSIAACRVDGQGGRASLRWGGRLRALTQGRAGRRVGWPMCVRV